MAVERVAKRVREGGHNIPTETIYRRYRLGLQNLFRIFMPIVDNWMFIENDTDTRLLADDGEIKYYKFYKIEQTCQNRK